MSSENNQSEPKAEPKVEEVAEPKVDEPKVEEVAGPKVEEVEADDNLSNSHDEMVKADSVKDLKDLKDTMEPTSTNLPSKFDVFKIEHICTNHRCNSSFTLNLYRTDAENPNRDTSHILCLKCKKKGYYWKRNDDSWKLKKSMKKKFFD